MRKIQIIIVVIAGLLFSLTASAQDKQTHNGMNKIEPLPRDVEIQLALSALPPHLRENATVYILNPDMGFEVARKGTNEFHAFVARTGDDTFKGSWPLTEYRDDILYPIYFDKAGSKDPRPLIQFGAEPSTERVCVDRNRLTGAGITAGVDFGITVAGQWAGESMGRIMGLIMEYAPQPPYGTGRPDLADAETLAAARTAMQQAMTGVPAYS